MSRAEGTTEIPAEEYISLHTEFPGFIAISKWVRRADQPSLNSMVNDIVKAIGPEQKGHAMLNKSKEFRLLLADMTGLRITKLPWAQGQDNARGDQNTAENSGPSFYALVTILPRFIAAMQQKAGHSNQLWDAILAVRKNMLVCAQAAVKFVLWKLIFKPYLAFSTDQNNQLNAAAVVQETYECVCNFCANPKPINQWPFLQTNAGLQLTRFGTAHNQKFSRPVVRELINFCINPDPELSTEERSAFYKSTEVFGLAYMQGVKAEIENLCGERYG
eukprot:SAG31_NODE_10118_length_1180_cov_1.764107_1_plen_274_part_01